jgi:3-hydroxyacyl-[acyl-carrier-protein] dehydratase
MTPPQSLSLEEIQKILPHRYPFLLVDRIIDLELGKRVVGVKNVSINEPFFQGHFPGRAIMPGVLIAEAMAQVGGILALLSIPENLGNPSLFLLGIDKMRIEVESVRGGKKFWKMKAQAFVNQTLVAEGEIMAAVGEGEE